MNGDETDMIPFIFSQIKQLMIKIKVKINKANWPIMSLAI